MINRKKTESGADSAIKPERQLLTRDTVLGNKPIFTGGAAKHKEQFEQLLDDAVLGVKKK